MDTERYLSLINGEYKSKFETLNDFLAESNKKFNLTSITEKEEVYLKHFLDSVIGESFIPCGSSVVEIGSGGGFPSLPLKIIRDDLRFTLIESTGKKCSYLQSAVDKLNLTGVKVCNARAEELAVLPQYRQRFDCAVARAVARLNTLCEYCLPFVKVGGIFIAYKGDADEELKEALNAVKILGGKLVSAEKYLLPNGDKRRLIIIKKVSTTPEKYPRGKGKEKKCPIT